MKRIGFIVMTMLLLGGEFLQAQTVRERGIGPYTLVTKRGEVTVRLLRRDGDIIWVDRLVQSGSYIETGIPRSEIIEFKSPKPALFEQAEQAYSTEQITTAIDQLRRMAAQLRPYRDLPGIQVNAAMIQQAKLNERRSYWRDALVIYQELLTQPYDFPEKNMIRYWSGLNLWRMGQKDKALEFLDDDPIPDEDMGFMSDVLNARADCYSAAGKNREAIDTYLSMIVFYPYVRTNELRAMSGIVPNYIALQDWDAVVKTVDAMKLDYAEAPETAATIALLEKYQAQVEEEKKFKIVEE
jgi:tetratricopeptide (TPR) repeat protein